jgi:hypothetical protein
MDKQDVADLKSALERISTVRKRVEGILVDECCNDLAFAEEEIQTVLSSLEMEEDEVVGFQCGSTVLSKDDVLDTLSRAARKVQKKERK